MNPVSKAGIVQAAHKFSEVKLSSTIIHSYVCMHSELSSRQIQEQRRALSGQIGRHSKPPGCRCGLGDDRLYIGIQEMVHVLPIQGLDACVVVGASGVGLEELAFGWA